MKKLLLTLFTVLLTADYCMAQEIILTTEKAVGERIQMTINADGDFTIEGVEEAAVSGYSGYTITASEIKLVGSITELSCPYSGFNAADVSKMPCLETLDLYGNPIATIDLSNSSSLKNLMVGYSKLTALDLSACTSLEFLNINNTNIESPVLSNCSSLKTLFANTAGIKNLDLTGLGSLEVLDCSGNKLSSIDLSQLKNLSQIACASNGITSLDLSNNTMLQVLNCNGNELTSIDLSALVNLQEVGCAKNKLTGITLPENSQIYGLAIYGNLIFNEEMTKLVSSLPVQPEYLDAYLTAVDLSAEGERNEMTVSNVGAAAEKNWGVYDYAGGMSAGFYGDPYEGMPDDMASVDDIAASRFDVYKAFNGSTLYVRAAAGSDIVISDVKGCKMLSVHAAGDVTVIDAGSLPRGVYVVTSGRQSVKITL